MKKLIEPIVIGTFLMLSASVFGQTAGSATAPKPGVYPTPKGEDPPRHKKEGSESKEEKKNEKQKPVPGADAGKAGSPFRKYMKEHNIP